MVPDRVNIPHLLPNAGNPALLHFLILVLGRVISFRGTTHSTRHAHSCPRRSAPERFETCANGCGSKTTSPTCGNPEWKASTLSVKWQRNSLIRSCCTLLVKTPASCCIWRVRRFIRVRYRSRYCTLIPVGKFREMYAFRDRTANAYGCELLVQKIREGVAMGINPFVHGSAKHTDIMKTRRVKAGAAISTALMPRSRRTAR